MNLYMNFILVSAFAAGLKKFSAYDLSQAQGRLFFAKLFICSLFFTPKLLNILPTTGAGDQGWRSDERTRLLPMWPGFDAICGLSLLLVFSLAPGERFFSGYSALSLPFSLKTLARTTWTSSGTVKPGLGETARISNLMNKALLQGLCLYYQ